ncbi:MAG: ACP S-malonyltransferase [Gemmatimonadetes bacterium]|nr:ACP S-malonyltransferase [Gemmatimonadota bacterium]MBI2403158.1 ACP S-malonyltransferase [Gemmatimonadota bacterium]MBI2615809.1 ACP S-malonyltransferase [Gemmatimonadota bacterium]
MTGVLLCPGQGAQRVGMGKDLAARFPAAREVFAAVDEALAFPLSRLAWDGPEADLTLTHNAQPAILTHTLAVHAVARAGLRPVAAAGHSLGEYSAYATAGSLALADAARLVRRRGELMLEAGQRRPGAMAAVLGLAGDAVAEACRDASAGGEVAVAANFNAPDQTVISGDPPAVERAGRRCKAAGAKRVLSLKVSGAFHSPLMAPAQAGLQTELERVAFADPRFPVIANATAAAARDAGTARRLLGEQLTAPVRWVEGMRAAVGLAGADATFLEIGPGKVLAGLLKRIAPEAKALSLGTADEVQRFLERAA